MRSCASLTLGFLSLLAGVACGTSDSSTGDPLPAYSGPVLPEANASESTSGGADPDAQDGELPSDSSAPITSPPDSSDEEGTDVSELAPSEPEPSGGSAGEDDVPPPAGGEGEEVAEPEPEPPVEPEPPAAEPATQVFILFGQSNMWGVPPVEGQDLATNPRVEVLTLEACGSHGANQWVPAQPPLHGCVGQPSNGQFGPGLGPGDYFGRVMAEAFPADTILLVPNAIPGVSIDVFQPGQQAYASTLNRARMAQQRGEIRGFIFHQGETDSGQQSWPGRVKTVVDRLRSDLGIGEVPFVAGELPETGCCGGHNNIVAQLTGTIDNAYVVQSDGLGILGDGLHFHTQAQREFGRRYGEVMLEALGR